MLEPVPAEYVVFALLPDSTNPQPVGVAFDVPVEASASKFWVTAVPRAVMAMAVDVSADGELKAARNSAAHTTSVRRILDVMKKDPCDEWITGAAPDGSPGRFCDMEASQVNDDRAKSAYLRGDLACHGLSL